MNEINKWSDIPSQEDSQVHVLLASHPFWMSCYLRREVQHVMGTCDSSLQKLLWGWFLFSNSPSRWAWIFLAVYREQARGPTKTLKMTGRKSKKDDLNWNFHNMFVKKQNKRHSYWTINLMPLFFSSLWTRPAFVLSVLLESAGCFHQSKLLNF